MRLKQLLSEEGIDGIDRFGTLLLDYESLLRALDVLVERNVRALGVEGFHMRGTDLVPDNDMIVDTSAATSALQSVEMIREIVIQHHDGKRMYELVSEIDESD
ncbi:hypothetical protein [Luteibacter yeojuensis]